MNKAEHVPYDPDRFKAMLARSHYRVGKLIDSHYDQMVNNFGEKVNLYCKYLLFISECVKYDDVESIILQLLAGNQHVSQKVLDQLFEYREKGKETKNPKVIKAKQILQDHYKSQYLNTEGQKYIYPILGGSLEFSDPVRMDADIILLEDEYPLLRSCDFDLIACQQLTKVWKRNKVTGPAGSKEPHATYLNLYFDTDPSWLLNNVLRLYEVETDIGILLTGITLYPEDNRRFEKIFPTVRKRVESDPLICVLVNKGLEDCLKTRQERASRATRYHTFPGKAV